MTTTRLSLLATKPMPAEVSLETLEQRLDDGYERIELARSMGQDVTAWEAFWIGLLHEYEALHDALPEAA